MRNALLAVMESAYLIYYNTSPFGITPRTGENERLSLRVWHPSQALHHTNVNLDQWIRWGRLVEGWKYTKAGRDGHNAVIGRYTNEHRGMMKRPHPADSR
jgi:hypothetical protein